MSWMNANMMRSIMDVDGYRDIDTFVETGTADAATACNMLSVFEFVVTIELSKELFEKNKRNFASLYPRLMMLNGDSAEMLWTFHHGMEPEVDKPCVFFLDAHKCALYEGLTAENDFPLWKELDIIKERPYADLVIVDDVHAFDRKRDSDGYGFWDGVTPKAIADRLDRVRHAAVYRDQFCVFRNVKEPVTA